MMNRDTPEGRALALRILGEMPTTKLLEALALVQGAGPGVIPSGGDEFLQSTPAPGSERSAIQSWNARKVKMGGSDRPAIADKKWAEGSGEIRAELPRTGQIDDGVDPTNIFLQTGGGS